MIFQRKNNIPTLDAFRGILMLWFYFYQSSRFDPCLFIMPKLLNFLISAPIGIDGFFALSGFILTHVYKETFNVSFQQKNILKTYIKFIYWRLSRFYPLYIVLSAIWVKPLLFGWKCTEEECLWEITFITPIKRRELSIGVCNAAAWTIINIFYAYMLFPIFYYILVKSNKNNKVLINLCMIPLVLLIFMLCKAFWNYIELNQWNLENLKYFDLNRTLFEFLAGMLLYRIYEKHPTKHWIYDVIICVLTVILFYLCLNYNYMEYYQHYSYIILIFPFFLSKMNLYIDMLLSLREFKFLGDISFSFLLSHIFWLNVFAIKVYNNYIIKISLYIHGII